VPANRILPKKNDTVRLLFINIYKKKTKQNETVVFVDAIHTINAVFNVNKMYNKDLIYASMII
jgi:hypothetical protein